MTNNLDVIDRKYDHWRTLDIEDIEEPSHLYTAIVHNVMPVDNVKDTTVDYPPEEELFL